MDALKNSGFWDEFTYKEEYIPNNINKEKIRSMVIKIKKGKIIWFKRPLLVDLLL